MEVLVRFPVGYPYCLREKVSSRRTVHSMDQEIWKEMQGSTQSIGEVLLSIALRSS
jgi:hypothetical protein